MKYFAQLPEHLQHRILCEAEKHLTISGVDNIPEALETICNEKLSNIIDQFPYFRRYAP